MWSVLKHQNHGWKLYMVGKMAKNVTKRITAVMKKNISKEKNKPKTVIKNKKNKPNLQKSKV